MTDDTTDSDTDPDEPADDTAPSTGDGPTADPQSADRDGTDGASRVRKVVYWATLAGLMLFGGFMVLLVYTDVRGLIATFVAREYRLLIETAFHLVLVLCAGIGVSLIVRRIEGLPGRS